MDKALEYISQMEKLTVKIISLHSNLQVISYVLGNEAEPINQKTQDDLYGALAFVSETLLDMAGDYEILTQKLEGEIKHG